MDKKGFLTTYIRNGWIGCKRDNDERRYADGIRGCSFSAAWKITRAVRYRGTAGDLATFW